MTTSRRAVLAQALAGLSFLPIVSMLSACGGSDSGTPTTLPTSTPTPTPSTTPTPSPTPTATPTPTPTAPAKTGPLLSSTLVTDFNADSIPVQAEDTALAQWKDDVGGIVFSQSIEANKPRYRAAGLEGANGRAYVRFSGSNWLSCAASAQGVIKTTLDSLNYTMIIVADYVSASDHGMLFGTGIGGDNFQVYADGTNIGRFDGGTGLAVPFAPDSGSSNTGYVAYGITADTSFAYPITTGSGRYYFERHYFRGLPTVSRTQPGKGTDGKTLGIGMGRLDSSPYFGFSGRIYRILIWNKVLSPSEMWEVEQYLNSYYGQQHPAVKKGRVLVLDGDSRTAGVGATTFTDTFAWKLAKSLGHTPGTFANFAAAGIKLSDNVAKSGEMAHVTQLGVPIRAFFEEYFNAAAANVSIALIGGQTTQMFGNMRTMFGSSAILIGASPMDHLNTSTVRQPGGTGSWGEFVKSDWRTFGMDAMVNMLDDAQIGYDHIVTGTESVSYDGVHLNDAGQTVQANLYKAVCDGISGF